MTSIELNKVLREYAKEDLQILKENGCSAITGTKKGCLHNTYENGVYSIRYNNLDPVGCLFQTPDEECVIDFFIDSYIVE